MWPPDRISGISRRRDAHYANFVHRQIRSRFVRQCCDVDFVAHRFHPHRNDLRGVLHEIVAAGIQRLAVEPHHGGLKIPRDLRIVAGTALIVGGVAFVNRRRGSRTIYRRAPAPPTIAPAD